MFKLVLEKAEEPEIKLPTSAGSWKKQESSRKASISALLTMPKPLTVWITINWSLSRRSQPFENARRARGPAGKRMGTSHRHGRYGIDAPYVPLLMAAGLLVCLGVIAFTPLQGWWLTALILAALLALYLNTTLRGKFAVWRELLDAGWICSMDGVCLCSPASGKETGNLEALFCFFTQPIRTCSAPFVAPFSF